MEAIQTNELEAGVKAILKLAEAAGVELPGLLRDDPLAHVPAVHFNSIADALKADVDTYHSENSMRWKLRHRDTNGLLACGAVEEVFSGAKGERARYVIHHKKWVKHALGLTGK